MAKGRLCVSFNSLIFGRVFLEVSFLASSSFVGASDLSLYVFQSSCVSPYIITPPVSASRNLCHLLRIYFFSRPELLPCAYLPATCPPSAALHALAGGLLSPVRHRLRFRRMPGGRRRGRRGIMEWWNIGMLSSTRHSALARYLLHYQFLCQEVFCRSYDLEALDR
jgi:hypothetical protein